MSDKEEIELLPCPFCGSPAEITILHDDESKIDCTNCTCSLIWLDGINSFSKKDLSEFWNKRTPSPTIESAVGDNLPGYIGSKLGNFPSPTIKKEWPSKQEVPEGTCGTLSKYDYENGWNACHDAFMAVINETVDKDKPIYDSGDKMEQKPLKDGDRFPKGCTCGQIGKEVGMFNCPIHHKPKDSVKCEHVNKIVYYFSLHTNISWCPDCGALEDNSKWNMPKFFTTQRDSVKCEHLWNQWNPLGPNYCAKCGVKIENKYQPTEFKSPTPQREEAKEKESLTCEQFGDMMDTCRSCGHNPKQELVPLDEKAVADLLEELHYDAPYLAKLICQKFGTPPAQKTLSLEEIQLLLIDCTSDYVTQIVVRNPKSKISIGADMSDVIHKHASAIKAKMDGSS